MSVEDCRLQHEFPRLLLALSAFLLLKVAVYISRIRELPEP